MSNIREHEDYKNSYKLATTMFYNGYKADPTYTPSEKLQYVFQRFASSEKYEACQGMVDAWNDFNALPHDEKNKSKVYSTDKEDKGITEEEEARYDTISQVADATDSLFIGLIDRHEYWEIVDDLIDKFMGVERPDEEDE